ncbi:MAG: leucine-rich repeat protein [Bacteroides sp.]|nr:leucine-rich repeat protein [Ruminococcus flavefaciens]MCM1554571.1 leucine-rich repeat protein [Bacteroides sp.]
MKKLASIALLLTSCFTYAFSQQSGTCGENLTWTLDADGTLTISGTGAMEDYGKGEAPWGLEITSLIIEKGVTNIGNYAFAECSYLTGSVTFPEGLTSIGNYAFCNCSGLGSLNFSEGLASIEEYAFSWCSGLTGALTFPNGLVSIGEYAFSNCTALTGPVTFPEGLTSIEHAAFYQCINLTGPLSSFPKSLKTLGEFAFSHCRNLTGSLNFSNCSELKTIGRSAFEDCSSLTGSVTFPEGLTSIEDNAFTSCSSLTGTLIFPASLKSIGEQAFWNCNNLTGSLSLPDGLLLIGAQAFALCSGFTGSLTIPDKLTSIASSSFDGCSGLTALTFPQALKNIGNFAFACCYGLALISNNSTIPQTISSDVFYDLSLSDIKLIVPTGTKIDYLKTDIWKEFAISDGADNVLYPPIFGIKDSSVLCGTALSLLSATTGSETYYGIGKDAALTLKYSTPIAITDTTYISAYAQLGDEKSDTVHAKYIPTHETSFTKVEWNWSAAHKANLFLACPRCETDVKPGVRLTESTDKEPTEDETGLKTYTATASVYGVEYKSVDKAVLPNLSGIIHDTVTKTDTVTIHTTDTITIIQTDTIIITDTVYIEVTGNTENESMKVKLYPNPTNGSFTVEAEEDAQLQIYDAAGACIRSGRTQGGRFTGSLPSSGLYFIKLTAGNRTYTRRLIVR